VIPSVCSKIPCYVNCVTRIVVECVTLSDMGRYSTKFEFFVAETLVFKFKDQLTDSLL
jgi:hypothetical protein